VIERHLDRYLIYDLEVSAEDEVWSCATMDQLEAWLSVRSLKPADFDEA